MGLFTKKKSIQQPQIKDNEMIVLSDEEESVVSEEEKPIEEEIYNDAEESLLPEAEPESKEVKWVKAAIEKEWDEDKIIKFLNDNNTSEATIEKIIKIYNDFQNPEDLPDIEEEVIQEPVLIEKSDNKDMQSLNNVLAQFDFRLSKLESYLFRSQNEYAGI